MAISERGENRQALRRRILKGGVVAFSGRHVTLPCVVRDISNTGARLQVQMDTRIPDTFELIIELDGFEAECVVVWRAQKEIGLQFVSEPKQNTPKRSQVVASSTQAVKPLFRRDRPKLKPETATRPKAETPMEPTNVTPIRPANVEPAAALNKAFRKPIPILIAEDDPDDRLLIEEAFRESDFDHPIDFVENGEELLQYLSAQGEFEGRAKPGLILLDLNMPKMDGRQALMHLKRNPATRRIPVIVFTTSNADDDIERTYDLGVSSYITKPSTFDGLTEVIRTLNIYWSNLVALPA